MLQQQLYQVALVEVSWGERHLIGKYLQLVSINSPNGENIVDIDKRRTEKASILSLTSVVSLTWYSGDTGSDTDTIFIEFSYDCDNFITFRWSLSVNPFVITLWFDEWFHFNIILTMLFELNSRYEWELRVSQSCFRFHVVCFTCFSDLQFGWRWGGKLERVRQRRLIEDEEHGAFMIQAKWASYLPYV